MIKAYKNCATRGQAKSQQEILDELADMIKKRRSSNGPIKNSSGVPKPTPVPDPGSPYGIPMPPTPQDKKKKTEWRRVKKTRKTSTVSHMDADGTLVYEEEEYYDVEEVEIDDEQIFQDPPTNSYETIWG